MRLAFIVPFRNRYLHLASFVPHYKRRWPNADIYIIEQSKKEGFNRAKLLNIGYILFNDKFDYFAAHDVDMICTKGNYDYCECPTQLATHAQQFRYTMPFPEYFGGATLFNKKDFELCDGYSNNFWTYGGEDNEMYYNVINNELEIAYRDNWYTSLHHARSHPTGINWENMEQAKRPRSVDDGLSCCTNYKILSLDELSWYTKVNVEL